MEIPFITTISLVWLIYTYLFIEADKQILDLFNRLKFSLAINNKGAIEKIQLEVKMYLGIPEVISFGEILKNDDAHKKNIGFFERKIRDIDLAKRFLIINLFLLTFHPIFVPSCWFITMEIHIILSLIFGLCFYWHIQQLPNLKFSQVVPMTESDEKS